LICGAAIALENVIETNAWHHLYSDTPDMPDLAYRPKSPKGVPVTSMYLFRPTYWAAALVLSSLAACQGGDSSGAPPVPVVDTGAPLAPGPEEVVGWNTDAQKTVFAPRGAGFRAGHQTHQVDVTNGLIEVIALQPQGAGPARRSPTLGLQTVAVWRGEVNLDVAALGTATTAPNVVETRRADLVEIVQNTPEGIEQSWRFDRAPQGQGDLMVAVDASGIDFAEATATGLHFRRAGELGLRYSHATWVDAAGDRWDIQAQYEHGRIVLAVPADVLASSSYPAVLDPTVTAELLTDTPVVGSSGVDNFNGNIATDGGTGYFVVWQDRRNTRNDDIWGTRVNSSGAVVDARGLKIFENASTVESNPTVAWVGNGWVVAWESAGDIAAAFVSSAGVVTQLGTIAGTTAAETAPALASRGSAALLTWMVDGADLQGAEYSGGAFGASFAIANSATAVEKNPAVAANPAGNYLVVFHEGATGDNIRAQLVAGGGTLTGAAFDVSTETGSQTSPSVSFNGTDFVAVWTTSAGTVDLRGARISTAGAVLDASPGVLVSGAAEQQTFPNISCASGSCWVTWQDRRNLATTNFDIFGATLSSAMAVGAETMVTTANRAQTTVASAVAGSQWFTVWTDLRDGEVRGMFGTRVTSAGAVMDAGSVLLGTGYDRHVSPVVSKTPTIWSVMWGASRSADYDVVHVRYNTNGAQLDATPLTISSATASQLPTSAVYTGTNLMAVWTDDRSGTSRDIYGARINPTTGAPIDATGFPVSTAAADQAGAKIASNGTTSLVVWQDRRSANFDIYASLLNADGTAAVANFLICANPGDQTRPAVAYDTTNGVYLVAWADPNGGATTDIRAARVSAAGALLDLNCGATVGGAVGSQLLPDIAFASGRFFVTWEDRRTDPNGDIYGARVSAAGGTITVQDVNGIAISAVANVEQSTPSVAAYGGNFVVAWEDARNLATTKHDIYGSRVVASSGVAEPSFAIANSADDEAAPDISDGPTASSPAKIAYLRTRLDLDSVRVQVRRITYQTSTGASCSNNTQCATGFCVDSKCCDTACGGGVLSDCQACSVARGAAVDGVCGVVAGPNLVICRNYAQVPGICDLREYCDGASTACPPDLGANQGKVCNTVRGTVCPSNSAAGAPHICP
jgi:hypothetical protein